MNTIGLSALCLFAVAWMVYLSGFRNRRVAFALWFPLTATSFLGTLLWLWAALGLSTAPASGGAGVGFAAMGMAMILGAFLICPIILTISIWQRPKAGSYGLVQILPIVFLCVGAIALYRPLSGSVENRVLILTTLDTHKKPVVGAKVHYETTQKTYRISFPTVAVHGDFETSADGTVSLALPKEHQAECNIEMPGYANVQVIMDRTWGDWAWHQTTIIWQFPPGNPFSGQGGYVQTDVDDTRPIRLTVYLPSVNAGIPDYGPTRVADEKSGKITWTPQPSQIIYHDASGKMLNR
jgi:hypothetical protein